ncbi:Ubiquinone/menaquinone biosynthesis C-methylase UbiE [Sporobacter termitidis DSM 10068]|uniref:Ubiquinone/menaquinone biosynthesis C-methylase UbiE n=1 Tax=Sporobacter termitidis DSM 10068 TaxID=1123282 RepID=A0A1M5W5J2_9FIRM|nr:class I SAM-dependent methyltransferase [Sporobacter termitidis]SHH82735.1 Ubiquinone/menaquinone biosynthesis C-methylase UbiE [Sporobacter termitidis DSM 10068]
MFRRFFQNTRKPEGFLGRMMLRTMNGGHTPLSNWALSLIRPAPDARVLDVGCGGGANIARLTKLCPNGFADGIDYSAESVAFSKKKNARSLGKRCNIRQGDVGALPYGDQTFNLVTAFETVYFWPDLGKAFHEILRVLKPGGQFLLVCEMDDVTNTTWTGLIDGMTIYSGEDLKARILQAGFASVRLERNQSCWIALLAEKRR